MTMIPGMSGSGNSPLQTTIAAASVMNNSVVLPHHPLTCPSELFYHEDGSFSCEHATAPPGDARTHQGVIHSVALLIIELALSL